MLKYDVYVMAFNLLIKKGVFLCGMRMKKKKWMLQ